MTLSAGSRLGPYEILAFVGAGGMGQVYRAKHVKLGRDVAIKVLPRELASDPERLQRFEREARAASALSHPNIVTIYDIAEHEGAHYIAMEFAAGRTLREVLEGDPLPLTTTIHYATQIVEGLAKAHAAGIVHRDLKPENLMVNEEGVVKILDFGLAKLTPRAPLDEAESSQLKTLTKATREGFLLGSIHYMSPEQAAGEPVGPRSDQFSLGVVLYELVGGKRPFEGSSPATIISAILRDKPQELKRLRADTPALLQRIVSRCLEKDAAKRFASVAELSHELARCGERLSAERRIAIPRRPLRAVVAAALVAVVVGSTWMLVRSSRVRWARTEALPEITRLTEAGELYAAYRLALEAERHIPGDSGLLERKRRITIPISVVTAPAGAQVFVKGYATPDASWELLGESPLEEVPIPYALMRWRISKPGFEIFEGAPFGAGPFVALATGLVLDRLGERPGGMVRVPGGTFERGDLPAVELEDYWLDRYEVTNEEFREFVAQGGYTRREYWTEPFIENGAELGWEEAVALFQDTTGRPGPATWEVGTFLEGRERFPVDGVSWYEAAAYCKFVGKSLPTLYHWYRAAAQDQLSDILQFSNFGTKGPVAVGSRNGIGDFGSYDMAGNVKEWCWNAIGETRYILGGAWSEPTYMFKNLDARSPAERYESQQDEAAHDSMRRRNVGRLLVKVATPRRSESCGFVEDGI